MLVCTSAGAQTPPEALIEQGRYLAVASDCTGCHTAPGGGKEFAGGYAIASPMGAIYSTNITPSKSFGIGNYTEEEFSRAIREGVRKDGARLYPAMTYTAYAKLTDHDVSALYAYFMHGVKPVEQAAPATNLDFPFSVRSSMRGWNFLYLDEVRFAPDPAKSAQWNRGAYLVQGPGHCGACHTPRNPLMAEMKGWELYGGPLGSWYAPNITSDPVSGIGAWSQEEIVRYLGTGQVPGKGQAAGPMAEAVEHSLQYLTNEDLNAIALYLKDNRPIRDPADTVARHRLGAPDNLDLRLRGAPVDGLSNGERVYSGNCASCHSPTGVGSKDSYYPGLMHNTATGAHSANNLIATVLWGVDRTVGGKAAFMPGFGKGSYVEALSDQDIVDVSNYVLSRYGNAQVKVSLADVALVRAGGPVPVLAKAGKFAVPGMILAGTAVVGSVWWFSRRRRRKK